MKRKPHAWGYNWATLLLGNIRINTGTQALQVGGVSNLRQLNMVISPAGLGPEYDYAGEGQQQL
jgi:hypothetical protein